MKEMSNFEKVFLDERWRNTYSVKEHFALEIIKEIIPVDSHCEKMFGDYLKGKSNIKYYGTLRKDARYVAVILDCDEEKHKRLLETLKTEEFSIHYKIIN